MSYAAVCHGVRLDNTACRAGQLVLVSALCQVSLPGLSAHSMLPSAQLAPWRSTCAEVHPEGPRILRRRASAHGALSSSSAVHSPVAAV